MNDTGFSHASANKGPLALYQERLRSGELRGDDDQLRVITRLDQLWRELNTLRAAPPAPKKSGLASLVGRLRNTPAPRPAGPRGVYIVGRVGRGKTMLMDLFYSCATIQPKRRIHFLHFMQEVHQRLHEAKRRNPEIADPIPPLGRAIAKEARLLCFDEFQVNDIADAMILGRLFEALFADGVIIVATSNTVPGDLFQNRPGADAFKPFIAIIRRETDEAQLDSPTDYRRGRDQDDTTWITPADLTARHRLDQVFERYADHEKPEPVTLNFSGRTLTIDQAAGRVARLPFNSLCKKPLGPADYLAIAQRFPVLIIDDIPTLGQDEFNFARRFITLIDALYDNGNLLFVSADEGPDQLFPEGEGSDAFARTASRLSEMSSESWLQRARTVEGGLARA